MMPVMNERISWPAADRLERFEKRAQHRRAGHAALALDNSAIMVDVLDEHAVGEAVVLVDQHVELAALVLDLGGSVLEADCCSWSD
jgi:hypothetical protein